VCSSDLFVVGSVICNEVIRETLERGYKPVFLNCGWRGEPLNPILAQQCEFTGARGPDTQAELARLGIEVQVTGDPASKVANMIEKGPLHGKSILVPHIKDHFRLAYSAEHFEVDEVLQPITIDTQSIIDLTKKISGAAFIFAGAMHAAIVAFSYGVPFAPFSTGFIDCPAKWTDWAKSSKIENIGFMQKKHEGLEWYKESVIK